LKFFPNQSGAFCLAPLIKVSNYHACIFGKNFRVLAQAFTLYCKEFDSELPNFSHRSVKVCSASSTIETLTSITASAHGLPLNHFSKLIPKEEK
jgi:hypothetical protein